MKKEVSQPAMDPKFSEQIDQLYARLGAIKITLEALYASLSQYCEPSHPMMDEFIKIQSDLVSKAKEARQMLDEFYKVMASVVDTYSVSKVKNK